MRRSLYFLILFTGMIMSCNDQEKDQLPNIIYILADDLGYGELGVYGQALIETPNIDALANSGMKFTQHYSGAPVCAPARCILLTGQHAGHAYVRGNDEWGARGKVWDYDAMYENSFLEGQRPLPDSIITIAEVLQQAGYKTGMVGKWGLGAPTTEGVPNKQGFDFFYGYNCQRQAHTYYPRHLWRNETRDLLDNKNVPIHANLPEGADPKSSASYADFNLNEYAPTLMHDEALQFIDQNKARPFFLYYASPIPHLPLQAPEKWVKYYQDKIGPEEPFTGTSYFPNLTPRATYAAMISYLDEQVGEILEKIKKLGLEENTLIIFSSDNGPTYTGGADTEFFDSAKPFKTTYGWGKGFVHEGGIRVPMIASWKGVIEPGTTTNHLSAFYDIFPTLCEVANVDIPTPIDGISFLETLKSTGLEQKQHDYLYWEFPAYSGQQAVRMNQWKGIRKNIFQGNMEIELYNLGEDLLELNNVAAQNQDVVEQIRSIMVKARVEPSIDRFKIEQLGDVKEAYLLARNRAKSLTDLEVNLQDGYFVINNRTKIAALPIAAQAVAVLQNRLQKTGGYLLASAKDQNDSNNQISFIKSNSHSPGQFKIDVNRESISLESNDSSGFSNAVNTLLSMMDESILEDFEMHNPTWTIAALTLSK